MGLSVEKISVILFLILGLFAFGYMSVNSYAQQSDPPRQIPAGQIPTSKP